MKDVRASDFQFGTSCDLQPLARITGRFCDGGPVYRYRHACHLPCTIAGSFSIRIVVNQRDVDTGQSNDDNT
jgi:hypothetical protein